MLRGAIFDETCEYRYYLTRHWNSSLDTVGFLLLNPSTADCYKEDPTTDLCIKYAKRWGYGSLIAVNLFAFKDTNPSNMKNSKDPIGKNNDEFIKRAIKESKIVIVAWGNDGVYLDRHFEVIKFLPKNKVYCLAVTDEGQPHHTRGLKKTLKPIPVKFKDGICNILSEGN